MIKAFKNLIGQHEAKVALSEIVAGRNYAIQNKKPFSFPPLLFTGLSGSGKTWLGLKFAEGLKDEGFRFEEVPVKAGWRYFDQLVCKVCSIDDMSGFAAAVPAVIF